MSKSIRTKYFEFTTGFCDPSFVYHFAGYNEPIPMLQIYPFWGKLFIYLPWRHYKNVKRDITQTEERKDKLKTLSDPNYKTNDRYKKELYYDESPSYGIYYHMSQIGIYYGLDKVKLIDMPWMFDWVRTSNMLKNNSWEHETKGNRKEFWDDNKWGDKLYKESFPYTYITNDGTVQKTTATIKMVEREWRLKYFKWFKYIKKTHTDIEVDFKDQIGESVNSYKGGVCGLGFRMLKNETPYQTLKRMENEKRFN